MQNKLYISHEIIMHTKNNELKEYNMPRWPKKVLNRSYFHWGPLMPKCSELSVSRLSRPNVHSADMSPKDYIAIEIVYN